MNEGSACRTVCTGQREFIYFKHTQTVVIFACAFGNSGTAAPVLDVAVRSADRSLPSAASVLVGAMFRVAVLSALACIVQPVLALYPPAGPVSLLNEGNFDSRLKNGAWMVEFYAPW